MYGISVEQVWHMCGTTVDRPPFPPSWLRVATEPHASLTRGMPSHRATHPAVRGLSSYGISMEYLWNRYGISMEYLWNMYGISVEYLWNIFGICMEYLWNIYGTSLEYQANTYGISMEYQRNISLCFLYARISVFNQSGLKNFNFFFPLALAYFPYRLLFLLDFFFFFFFIPTPSFIQF